MKYWGYLVAILYAAVLMVIAAPICNYLIPHDPYIDISWGDLFFTWYFWVFVGLLVAIQLVLLYVPVHTIARRPVTRKPLKMALVTTAICCSLLAVLSLLSIIFGCGGDNVLFILYYGWIVVIGLWIFWSVRFYKYFITKRETAGDGRVLSYLLAGSILELLIAVPCHIAMKNRDVCCAPMVTSVGIATGIALMLLSFGPGVLFLYAERVKRLQPRHPTQQAEEKNESSDKIA